MKKLTIVFVFALLLPLLVKAQPADWNIDQSANVAFISDRIGLGPVGDLNGYLDALGQAYFKAGLQIGGIIGANIPTGYKLYVEEGILTERVKVAVKGGGEWSDYIFDKEYSLPTLQEVENHIEQHGHLIGIPSADEVVKDGLDLGQMDAKLLAKIEELTLYMIDVNKRVKSLENENKLLKEQLELVTK